MTRENVTPKNGRSLSRRRLIAGLGASGVAALAGCSSSGSTQGSGATTTGDGSSGGGGSESHTIQVGSAFEPDHILVRAVERFGDKIAAETDDRITITVNAGGSLGGEEAVLNAVQSGSIQAHVGGGLPVSMFASDYYFVDTPYIMKDWEHFKRVWNSEAFQPALDQIKEQGNQRNLGVIYRGVRHYTANKAVETPETVQGMKLRLPQLDDWVKIWKEIGVNPTPVALNELYSALQQGTADASEGPAQQVYNKSLHEVQSHYSLTGHMVQSGGFYINEEFFQGLSDDDQQLVVDLADEATTWASETAKTEEEELIQKLSDEGMTIVEDVDTEAFRQAGISAVKELFDDQYALTWDNIQSI